MFYKYSNLFSLISIGCQNLIDRQLYYRHWQYYVILVMFYASNKIKSTITPNHTAQNKEINIDQVEFSRNEAIAPE